MSAEGHVWEVTREECQAKIDAILAKHPALAAIDSDDRCACCCEMDVADEYGGAAARAWEQLENWRYLRGDDE